MTILGIGKKSVRPSTSDKATNAPPTSNASEQTEPPRELSAPIHFIDPASNVTIIGASIRGASHVQANTNCQDAYRISAGAASGKPWFCIAVGDGHGSAQHDLSEFGSFLVCRRACDLLEAVAIRKASDPTLDANLILKDKFPAHLRRTWLRDCKDDYITRAGERPDSDEEQDGFSDSRYGTTFIAVLVHGQTIYAMRVGDGDIVCKFTDGIRPVFKPHEGLVGSQTHSMATDGAPLHYDFEEIPRANVLAAFVTTDGLPNSYAEDKAFYNFLDAIHEQSSEYGAKDVADLLPKSLAMATRTGSRDDITLVTLLLGQGKANEADPAVAAPADATPDDRQRDNRD